MPTVIDARGVVTTPGAGPTGLNAGSKPSVTALTAATTLTRGGLYTVSSSAALTITLPHPSGCIGEDFVFRCLSAHAHQISASQVPTAGDKTICAAGGASGARLALSALVGSSCMLKSDGVNFLVTGLSGTATITTPTS